MEKADSKAIDQIVEIGKLLKKPSLVYRMASEEKKVHLVKSLVENFSWRDGKLTTCWKNQYKIIAERAEKDPKIINIFFGSPRRDIHRTWSRLIPLMMNLLERKNESQEKIAA